MTPLPRSLAMQQVTIAIFFILAVFQAYLSVSEHGSLNLRGFATAANPLGCMFIFLAEYPKIKQTVVRIPVMAFGIALALASVYILFTQ
jgi:hypothetical protein